MHSKPTWGAALIGCLALMTGGLVAPAAHAALGDLLWAKQAGGIALDASYDIAVDVAGNALVTGQSFSTSLTFGAGEVNETTLTSPPIFVAKYAPDGTLLWARSAVGSGGAGIGIAVDAAGNAVVTGAFYGSATFGAGEANETTLSSAGDDDIFVAKYAPGGSLLWARSAGGLSRDIGNGITVDAAGNALLSGVFFDSATFGAGEANETTLPQVGGGDVVIAKYAPNGTLLWARSAGGGFYETGNGIAVDAAGNSLVTGEFAGSATFGAGEANETTLTATEWSDIFIARYAPDGTLLWARSAGGSADDVGTGIVVDATGNALATGSFRGSATFGAGEANETTLTAVGLNDIFIAQYAPDGSLLWARSAGGVGVDYGYGIAVDVDGNAAVTGYFRDSATFGAGEANETTLTDVGGGDIFIAQYAPDGSLLWARSAGGESSFDGGRGIAVDVAGNALVTGGFGGSATFGAGEANKTTLTAAGSGDIFIAKYAGALSSETLNDFVSFGPDQATYSFTPDASGCPSGFVGKFGFAAQLANISQSTLTALQVQVAELSNGNLVLTEAGTTIGEGGSFPVPDKDDYSDGDLAPSEAVDVPFTICLKNMQPFRFFVDVLGKP